MVGMYPIVKRTVPWLSILLFIILYIPATSLAETPSSVTTPTTESSPAGAAASTYKYNPSTGQWENDHYIWDPVTHRTTPKDTPTYSYNPATGMWDTIEWIYNATTGKYEASTKSVAQAPAGAATIGGPVPAKPAQTIPPSGASEQAEPTAQSSSKGANEGIFDGFYNANISNSMSSSAKSGDANVVHNTTAGNATSGTASTTNTILNLLQSTATLGDLNTVATFTTNIDGNVAGDLHIDPAALGNVQLVDGPNPTPNITVNNASNNSINNTIAASAKSGDANVSDNTTAGNAVTGNANATVNLINMLNSTIAAGQSFIGTLNINGNFNGDILLPLNTINALMASNAGSAQANSSLRVTDASNQGITNKVVTSAATGGASVASNTTGGSAASGGATTKVTLLNFTGREVVDSNSLFVFINVLGQWVGAIFDAPQGSTAAVLGGGVAQDKTSDLRITDTSNNSISNDITVSAQSGNALVNRNTTAGNAISGDAMATANIANISNSSLSVSDWFGILFINVFGTWNGSFGVDTSAGDFFGSVRGDQSADNVQGSTPQPRVLSFTTRTAVAPGGSSVQKPGEIPASQNSDPNKAKVLGVVNSGNRNGPNTILAPTQHDINLAAGAVVVGVILVGIERVLAYRDRQRHM